MPSREALERIKAATDCDPTDFPPMTGPSNDQLHRPIALRVGALVLTMLGIFPLAAVMKSAPIVAWLLVAAREWAVTLPALVAVCLLTAHWLGDRTDTLIDRGRAVLLAPSPRDFAAWSALLVLTLSVFFGWYCFGLRPVDTDEVTQRFQANLLVHGRLWGVAQPFNQFFSGVQTVRMGDRWFSQFPVGGPLLLAIGVAVGTPWIVNPLLAAWTASSFYRFNHQVTDEVTARGATLLFALSPMVLFMSGSEMNHVGALAFMMFALAALPEWSSSDDPRRLRVLASCIGFGVAASATIRPYDAALAAAVISVAQLAFARGSSARWRSLGWQVTAGMIPMALLFFVNWRTTGSPSTFGYEALNGAGHRPGFHVDPTGVDFTPFEGLRHISSYLLQLNTALLSGPIPALVPIVLALTLIPRATRWDLVLVGVIGAIVIGYWGYWAGSVFVGPRFLYMGIPAFLLFAARMPNIVAERMPRPAWRRAALMILPASVAVGWMLPPHSIRYIGGSSWASQLRDAEPSWKGDISKQITSGGLTNALVFVHDSWHRRLSARLSAIGTPSLQAERMVMVLDACVLQLALDAEEARGGPPSLERSQRVALRGVVAGEAKPLAWLAHQQDIALVPGRPLLPECADELEADRNGVASFDQFLTYAEFSSDGHLGGRIVFARDFGALNARLLRPFGDRSWYRYRPPTGPNDHEPVFIPYAAIR